MEAIITLLVYALIIGGIFFGICQLWFSFKESDVGQVIFYFVRYFFTVIVPIGLIILLIIGFINIVINQ